MATLSKQNGKRKYCWYGVFLCVLILVLALGIGIVTADDNLPEIEQVVLSPTANSVIIPTATPLPTAGVTSTPVPPTFTPTVPGPPQLEVNEVTLETVVRREPIPDAEEVGTIRVGDQYTITGRFFQWLQFRFDPSPTGFAWVFDGVVTISGDETLIPEVDVNGQRLDLQGGAVIDETQTAIAFQQTPGFELTLTADVRFIEAPGTAERLQEGAESPGVILPEGTDEVVSEFGILPTFTYPPNVVAQAPTDAPEDSMTPTPVQGVTLNVSDGIAPIVPIVVLASLGIIGLLLSLIRR